MRTYILTFALITSFAVSSALAQAAEDAAPPKTGVASSSPKPAEEKIATPKRTAEPEKKKKQAATSSSAAETKAEVIAPPLGSTPAAETKPPAEQLPFKLNEESESIPAPPSTGGLLLRTFGALLFIIGLIAAAGWGLRHFGIVNFGKPSAEAAGLKVLNTISLGDRRSLSVVKFGERTLLIGSTAQGLTLLAEQNDEAEAQGSYMPTVRTVTDLLDVEAMPHFDEELTRASLLDSTWRDRRMQ